MGYTTIAIEHNESNTLLLSNYTRISNDTTIMIANHHSITRVRYTKTVLHPSGERQYPSISSGIVVFYPNASIINT